MVNRVSREISDGTEPINRWELKDIEVTIDNAPTEVGIEPVNGLFVSKRWRTVTEPLVHAKVTEVRTKVRQLEFDDARTQIDVGQPIASKMSI